MEHNRSERDEIPVVNSRAARAVAAVISAAMLFSAVGVVISAVGKKSITADAADGAAEESALATVTTAVTTVPAAAVSDDTLVTTYEFRKAGVQEYNTASAAHTTTTAAETEPTEAETEEAAPAELVEMDETVLYMEQSVNFRTEPSLSAPIIYIFNEGDSVIGDGITSDDKWYSVYDDNGMSGYILAELVTDKAPENAEKTEAPAAQTTAPETSAPKQTTTEAAPAVNTGVISYTDIEFRMMCYVVQSEVGNCSEENKLAVANVIINRVKSELFPNTLAEVLTAPNQFTAVQNYYSQTNVPSEDTMNVVKRALNGEGAALVNGATFYYAPAYSSPASASWFENSLQLAAVVDGQRYFKNK
ncbi:MAG: cell wall hydrolase [Ruminococcus sp.]|nr:cell wall hydrolase [Ruminococcus sp.]